MQVVQSIQQVMDWLEANVCPKVTLKVPPEAATRDAAGYEWEQGHPSVHGMYWPVGRSDCAPGARYPHPGILVQLVEGTDSMRGEDTTMRIRLHLSAWNPGRHAQDTWSPLDSKVHDADGAAAAYGYYERGEEPTFDPYRDDGWRDAWNFCDVLRRELREAREIGDGLAIDRTEDMTFGPYSEQGAVIDLYPYFFAWVEVTLRSVSTAPTWANDFL